MNTWKNHKFSLLLGTGSLLLLLLFQIFWLNNTYQNEKDSLRKKADLVFEDAVRSVEDSLFQMILLDDNMIKTAKESRMTVKKIINDPQVAIQSFSDSIQFFEGDTMVNLKIDLRTDFSKKNRKNSFGSIALWMSNDSSHKHSFVPDTMLFDNGNFEIIQSKLNHLMAGADLPTPYEVITLKNDEIPKGDFYSNSHTDILSQKSYAIYFPSYKNHLFQKILPQLLFSIFLFGAILLSFFMAWQSLEKQRRLTELKNDFISNVTHELKTPLKKDSNLKIVTLKGVGYHFVVE